MLQILLKLTFCAIHLCQDLTVLIFLLLTLQLLKSKIRQYNHKLWDGFSLLVLLSVLQVDALRFRMLCFSSCSISSVSGKTQFDTLFVSNFKAPFMLSLLIKILIFIEILVIVMLLSDDFNFSCIVCPS